MESACFKYRGVQYLRSLIKFYFFFTIMQNYVKIVEIF